MQSSAIRKSSRLAVLGGLLILVISAISYLVLVQRLGFSFDDWYLLYAGQTGGFAKFFDVFVIDRPFRAFFVGPVFELFGLNPLPYHLLSYALRATGALAMFWLLRLLWPEHFRLTLSMAVLFAVYPGWIDQPAPFDYQSHLLAFALEVFSLALSVLALRITSLWKRGGVVLLAVVFQVISLLLMEYYIGLEGLRFVLIAWLLGQRDLAGLFRRGRLAQWRQIILAALPYLLGTAVFLFWRVFLFDNTRAATDIGGMFTSLAGSPVMRGLWMLVNIFLDLFNVTVFAWFVPVYQNISGMRLRDSLIMIAVGMFATGILASVLWMLRQRTGPDGEGKDRLEEGYLVRDLLLIGALGVLFSIVPVALGNRHVVFPSFARFSLPGSVGAVLVLGGLLASLRLESTRIMIAAALVGLAVMGHFGNATRFADSWAELENFWWQMSWRAPQIAPETVLLVEYPSGGISEDYFVWGPANLVYYPEANTVDGKSRTPLASMVLNESNVQAARMQLSLGDRDRRGLISGQDLGNALVVSMPPGGCMRIIDGHSLELSENDSFRIQLIAPSSKIDRVQTDSEPHTPPADLFGQEPPHDWCFYYQKASLARQRGDWEEVGRLGDEALMNEQRPLEWVEWMPFVQAYAYLGRYDRVNEIAAILRTPRFLQTQACQLTQLDAYGYAKTYPEGHQVLLDQFCQ